MKKKGVFKIHKKKIARTAVYQSPIQNGLFTKTKPRVGDSGDKVAPCGVSTKNERPQRHTVTPQVASNTKIGPILSVRAFAYGVDFFIPAHENNNLPVWITACSGNQVVCRRKGFKRSTEDDAENKSMSTSSSARNIPVHAEGNQMLHAGGNFMPYQENHFQKQNVDPLHIRAI